MSAIDEQIGGDHYKRFEIQPFDFIHKNGIGFAEGNAIKYLCRWRDKGGIQDLEKARHYINLLIESERQKFSVSRQVKISPAIGWEYKAEEAEK